MVYLICDKCGGYYELQPGESAADFEGCQCGGNLIKAKEIPSHSSNKENFDNRPKNLIQRIFFLIIGAVLIATIHTPYPYLAPLGGLIAALVIGGSYKDGIINGSLAGLIATVISIASEMIFGTYNFGNIPYQIGLDTGNFVFYVLLGLITGIFGILIRNAPLETLKEKNNILAIIIGCIISIAPFILTQSFFSFISVAVGGLIAAYITSDEYETGIFYGLLVGGLGLFLILIIQGLRFSSRIQYLGPDSIIFGVIIGCILGIVGATVGIFIKKRLK